MKLDPLQQYAKLHRQLTEEKSQLERQRNARFRTRPCSRRKSVVGINGYGRCVFARPRRNWPWPATTCPGRLSLPPGPLRRARPAGAPNIGPQAWRREAEPGDIEAQPKPAPKGGSQTSPRQALFSCIGHLGVFFGREILMCTKLYCKGCSCVL
jgi:hypothetical protein